jgi:GTPase SAR1 family protein
MTTKKFTSANIEETLEQVARELGEDAFIIKTERVDGLVSVTASTVEPEKKQHLKISESNPALSGYKVNNFQKIINDPNLGSTLVFGQPGSGKTTFIRKFLLDRNDQNIHYIRHGENHLFANTNSAILAGVLECDFSYGPIRQMSTIDGATVVETDIEGIGYGESPFYQRLMASGQIQRAIYVIDAFETIQLRLIEKLSKEQLTPFVVYNKKDTKLRNYLKQSYVDIISAAIHRDSEGYQIITDHDKIQKMLAIKTPQIA